MENVLRAILIKGICNWLLHCVGILDGSPSKELLIIDLKGNMLCVLSYAG